MSQQERSKWRDDYFPSRWHRAPRLPEDYLLTDVDAVEWRKDSAGWYVPAGLFEYKIMYNFKELIDYIVENDRLNWQLHFLKNLAYSCRCPAFFVGYEYGAPEEIVEVRVFEITSWEKGTHPEIKVMSEGEYLEFLLGL